jgi:hypothetical protein
LLSVIVIEYFRNLIQKEFMKNGFSDVVFLACWEEVLGFALLPA